MWERCWKLAGRVFLEMFVGCGCMTCYGYDKACNQHSLWRLVRGEIKRNNKHIVSVECYGFELMYWWSCLSKLPIKQCI